MEANAVISSSVKNQARKINRYCVQRRRLH